MIKVEVIKKFTLKGFDKIQNLIRGTSCDKYGELYIKDTFECDENMAKYLTGKNEEGAIVVKVIEVEPKVIPLTDNEECIIPLANKEELEKHNKVEKKKSQKKESKK